MRKAEPECWSQLRSYESLRNDPFHGSRQAKEQVKERAEAAAEEYFDALQDVTFAWRFLQNQSTENQVDSPLLADAKLSQEIAGYQAMLDKVDDIRFDPAARVEIFFDNLMDR